MADPGGIFADTAWFMFNLGGPLLLLAGGLKGFVPAINDGKFIALYCFLVALFGSARLQLADFRSLVGGWVCLAIAVSILLLLLKRPTRWITVGAVWCVLVLGAWSYGGVLSYLSAAAPQLPAFLGFQMLGCILALAILAHRVCSRRVGEGRQVVQGGGPPEHGGSCRSVVSVGSIAHPKDVD